MINFNVTCAQGDVYFNKIAELPANLNKVNPENGKVIVTHSETGHHHSMLLDKEEIPAVEMFTGDNPLMAWLKVNRPIALDHERSYDTHRSIVFDVGIYEVRRQREYTPEGFRQVQD